MDAARRRNEKNGAPPHWAVRVAAGRGKAGACVALARKLAGILYAMWRDGTRFYPTVSGRDVVAAAVA